MMPGIVRRSARTLVRGSSRTPSEVVWRGDAARGALALTFDDGPSPWTDAVLDLLGEHDAVATFFVVGNAIGGREDTLRRTAAAGHEIGNHTFSHPLLDTLPPQEIESELEEANKLIESIAGRRPTVFRPPGLRYNRAVIEAAGRCGFDRIVNGSVVGDWELDSHEEIAARVLSAAEPGAIVILHDGRPFIDWPLEQGGSRDDRLSTVHALERVLSELRAAGLELVTVSDLLAT